MAAGPIEFAGFEWSVKDSNGRRVGPGDNYFARGSVSARNDGLLLSARVGDSVLNCAEVVLERELSYGTYRFTVATDLSRLASTLTLGMFLWSDDSDFAHREIDIEAGRWGDATNQDMQFVLQPYAAPGNMLRFSLGAYQGPSVHTFSWRPGRIEFETFNGPSLVKQFVVTRGVPPPGAHQRVHLNLWNTTNSFINDGVIEVLITGFEFEPIR